MQRVESEQQLQAAAAAARLHTATQLEMEAEMERLRQAVRLRETELAQLTSTPLAHRVDVLQQQISTLEQEKEAGSRRAAEAEARLKTVKAERKQAEKAAQAAAQTWQKEREALESRAREVTLTLQELVLKHTELSTRQAFLESGSRRLEEQLRASEAERKEQQGSVREMTRLQVKEEMSSKELERAYAERKEMQEEIRRLREESRAQQQSAREQHDAAGAQRQQLQRELDEARSGLAAGSEKLATNSERLSAALKRAEEAGRDGKKDRAEVERLRTVGVKLELEYKELSRQRDALLDDASEREAELRQAAARDREQHEALIDRDRLISRLESEVRPPAHTHRLPLTRRQAAAALASYLTCAAAVLLTAPLSRRQS